MISVSAPTGLFHQAIRLDRENIGSHIAHSHKDIPNDDAALVALGIAFDLGATFLAARYYSDRFSIDYDDAWDILRDWRENLPKTRETKSPSKQEK